MSDQPITIETKINAPIEQVWEKWTQPEHIVNWAFASDEWEAPEAENELRVGGNFKTVMAAKDGSAQFDFAGTYTHVVEHEALAYEMEDGRKVAITFEETPDGVHVVQSFDPETENPRDMQQQGWQAILDNFKNYVESNQS